MIIERFGDQRVRLALSANDLQALGVTCRDLLFGGQDLLPALKILLSEARAQAGFDSVGKKLFIEVYPDGDGGCVLFLTALPRRERPRRYRIKSEGMAPYLFDFPDPDALYQACRAVYSHMSHRILRSSLYAAERRLVLSVCVLDAPQCRAVVLLGEFARRMGRGRLLEGIVREHSRLICDGDAIGAIARPS